MLKILRKVLEWKLNKLKNTKVTNAKMPKLVRQHRKKFVEISWLQTTSRRKCKQKNNQCSHKKNLEPQTSELIRWFGHERNKPNWVVFLLMWLIFLILTIGSRNTEFSFTLLVCTHVLYSSLWTTFPTRKYKKHPSKFNLVWLIYDSDAPVLSYGFHSTQVWQI